MRAQGFGGIGAVRPRFVGLELPQPAEDGLAHIADLARQGGHRRQLGRRLRQNREAPGLDGLQEPAQAGIVRRHFGVGQLDRRFGDLGLIPGPAAVVLAGGRRRRAKAPQEAGVVGDALRPVRPIDLDRATAGAETRRKAVDRRVEPGGVEFALAAAGIVALRIGRMIAQPQPRVACPLAGLPDDFEARCLRLHAADSLAHGWRVSWSGGLPQPVWRLSPGSGKGPYQSRGDMHIPYGSHWRMLLSVAGVAY